jgi:cation diffusion facilitator CzcD-associated flavoprotein CzcO
MGSLEGEFETGDQYEWRVGGRYASMIVGVIGAGAAGLAAARRLQRASVPFEVIERERDVGGIWDVSLPHSPVYHSAHLISSKPLTQFPDFPMPREYPDYPDHAQALAYLRSYARRFGLYDYIRFGRTVEQAERMEGGGWKVSFARGETRSYDALIVASGIHWAPSMPRMAGTFDGERMHSCGYKTPEIFRGKRVLVVGAGNSGCDIAVDACQHASRTLLSVRRGYHFIPKYAFGRPIDQVGELSLKLRLPLTARRALNELVLKAVVGRPEEYGLPRPDHRLLESHPIVNSRILPALRRGELRPKPDVVELGDREVVFKDGTSEPVDLIVFATGYQVTFPFLEPRHLNSLDFHLHVFHPTYDDLFILGMIQPDSGVWPLMDLQARAVAVYLRAGEGRAFKQGPRPDLSGGIRYLRSERHRYEVEHSTYARQLRRVIRLLES